MSLLGMVMSNSSIRASCDGYLLVVSFQTFKMVYAVEDLQYLKTISLRRFPKLSDYGHYADVVGL